MGRPPVAERMEELKRGPWTPVEDIMLASYIQEHGPGNWRLVPSNAGLQRCGKSCRLRWKNYLRPGIIRGNFTPEEDRVIIRYQALLGNRWAAIAAHLPSRTDNDIKNYWHTHLKKNLGEVNGSGDERAQNYEGSKHNGDAAASGLDHMKAYCEAGNSMTTTPQNNELKKSVYDDIGIPALKSIEKWLLDDPSAPFPQILSVPAPAPVSQVFPAQAPAAVPQVLSAPVSAVVSQVFPSPAPAPQVPPVLTPIEKWLLENSSAPVPRALPAPFPPFLRALVSAPVPQVLHAQAPAPFPQVTPALEPFPQVTPAPAPAPSSAPGHKGHDHPLNMFAPFGHGQIPFGPFTDHSIRKLRSS